MPPARISDEELQRTLACVAKHGGSRVRAARELGIPATTVKTRLQRAGKRGLTVPPPAAGSGVPVAPKMEALGRLAALLEKSGIDLDEVGRVEKIRLNEWDGFSKDADGQPVVTRLQAESIVLTPKWADGPSWPVLAPAPPVVVTPMPRPPVIARESGWRTAVILPDAQIGYWRDPNTDALHPTHDEAALAVALDITHAADPDVVVLLGDYLDLPELSRYRLQVTFQRTTQAAINRMARFAASLRARVRPECKIVLIAGNHEERMPRYALDNAAASFGLKRANAPDSWPVLSVPHLCRFDEYDVTFLPGYPANVYRINDHLRCIHGDKVKSGGNTAQLILKDIRHSTVIGHIHRIEHAAITKDTNDGPRTYHAVSPGCLCKINGAVPGHEAGYDLDGRPLATVNNWAQGLLVVPFEPGDGRFRFEQVEIWRGHALWRGREYAAPADLAEAV